LAPDFVVELLSKQDQIEVVRGKMREYVTNGVRLGWMIDPFTRCVEVYRPGVEPVTYRNPGSMSGDPELAGFVLDLGEIW
jgi:Uma2 family endonuclease